MTANNTKFRGFTIDTKQWVYGWYVEKEDSHSNIYSVIVSGRDFEVSPESVSQFTGLHDSKGQEIYGGDIFKFVGGLDKGDFGFMGYNKVYYNKHTASWGWIAWNRNITPFYTYCVHGSTDGGGVVGGKMMKTKEKIKVIGNATEHPSLLKGDGE